jgi:hypothetical protein
MLSVPELSIFDVSLGSQVNGAYNSYTINFVSGLPHVSGDIISFTFPPEITLPSSIGCQIMGLITALTCTKIGTDSMTAVMTFAGGSVM